MADPVESLLPELGTPVVEDVDDEALGDFEGEDVVVADEEAPPIGRSWRYDWVSHRFRDQTSRGIVATRGHSTLQGWIEKALRTDRGAHPIHPDNYGLERAGAEIGMPEHLVDVADLEERVHACLTFHPAIVNVREFEAEFDEDAEALYMTFTVVLDDDEEIAFEDHVEV